MSAAATPGAAAASMAGTAAAAAAAAAPVYVTVNGTQRLAMLPTNFGGPGQTSIVYMWVPVVVFAHVFAAFWLAKTWMVSMPGMQRHARQQKREASKLAKQQRLDSLKTGNGSGSGGRRRLGTAVGRAASGDVSIQLAGRDVSEDVPSEQSADEVFEALEASAPLPHSYSVHVAPTTLEWQGMGCSYNTPAGPKEVLADVWGIAQPGEMQALLGPSGAGKSTFMDILAMRKSIGNLSGRLLVNGQRATKRFIKRTAYVPQEDNFVPTMTTWEVMSFYSQIILPDKWSNQRRKERFQEVLAEVGLAHAHRTIVGGTLPGGLLLRGLSGGERKRLAIATGILAAPSVLFLDEPTSGLDSFAALTVMGYLKRMVREQHHVVVASIHQPRSAIWMMFDAVTLLASGRLMFHGPREGMTAWFGSLGYAYDPSLHGVPSDWALDLVTIGFAKPARFYGNTITTLEGLVSASRAFRAHYLQENSLTGGEDTGGGKRGGGAVLPAPRVQDASGLSLDGVGFGGPSGGGGDDEGRPFASSAWRQYKTLFGRELLSITRNPFDVAGRVLTFTWVGIAIGILYYGLPYDANSARSRLNLVYMLLTFYCLMPYTSMGLYSADKKFYLSDASSQLYRPLAYYLAKVSAITPFQIVSACVYGLTVYGMAGLRPGAVPILKNAFACMVMYLIASQVLHMCAIIGPNQDVAFMLSILWTTIQLLLSGFFVNWPEVLMKWITYLRYVSATYYSFEAAAINEFQDVRLSCAGGMPPDQIALLLRAFPNAPDSQRRTLQLFLERDEPNCVFDTEVIIEYFHFWRPFWMSATILVAYLLITHLLTFTAMIVAARNERR